MSRVVPSPRDAERTAAGAASAAVFVTFLLSGFNFSGWAARLPAVRDALDLSPNQMGVLLLVAALFSLAALPLSGWVVQLLGARRTVQISASMNSSGLIIAPPLLGVLAEHVGYRNALLAITVPVVIGLFVVRAARPLPAEVPR